VQGFWMLDAGQDFRAALGMFHNLTIDWLAFFPFMAG